MFDETKLPNMLRIAKKMANLSSGDYMLGAVVMKSGRVMGKGFNKYNAINAMARRFFGHPTIHAEIAAMSNAPHGSLNGASIWVYRTRRDGSPGLSFPCARCQVALKKFGIRRVIYSIPDYPYYMEIKCTNL